MLFNALIAEVQSDINDLSARTKTRIEGWINDGVQAICIKRRWSFLRVQVSDETSLVDTDMPLLFSALKKDTLVVPAKFITNVYDTTDGTRQEVCKVTYEHLNQSDTTSSEDGPPLYWYETNDPATNAKSLQFFPKLTTATRKFVFSYVRSVPKYTASELIIIPDEYIHVLKSYVYYRVYKYKSDDRADGEFNDYRIGISDMIRDCSTYSMVSDGTGRLIDRFSNGVTGV